MFSEDPVYILKLVQLCTLQFIFNSIRFSLLGRSRRVCGAILAWELVVCIQRFARFRKSSQNLAICRKKLQKFFVMTS